MEPSSDADQAADQPAVDQAAVVAPLDQAAVDSLREARQTIQARIAEACARVGRDPGAVALLAVSKTVPAARLRAAMAAGQHLFGENRVQEAEPKIAALPRARFQLVGHLQSNKAGRAAELFAVIQSVDSLELAGRLGRLGADAGRPLKVYLQVNVDADDAKEGFDPAQLEACLDELASLEGIDLLGLMTVGRLVSDPEQARPTFARLRELSERLRARQPALGGALSMGMSDDFEVAVEEGATLVRVGRALFGERPTA